MTAGKTIALTRWIFVIKMISLLFNMLYRCFIAFYFLTLWLWSPSTMVLKPKKIKSVTVFTNMATTQKEIIYIYIGFLGVSVVKNQFGNAGDVGWILH